MKRVRSFSSVIFTFIFIAVFVLNFSALSADENYTKWLEDQSMLYQGGVLAQEYSGSSKQWQYPYGNPEPAKLCGEASLWFSSYPASIITKEGQSVLQYLAQEKLWEVFDGIGIHALHTGPLKRSGGIDGKEYTPTVDGYFDRISLEIAPEFGTEAQYKEMVKNAAEYSSVIAGDVVPGHTGKGADFLLATMKYKDYPGIYHIIEINEKDWDMLPSVPEGKSSINLSPDEVLKLKKAGYIVGKLRRVIFYAKGIKETNWSATDTVKGTDGKERRWVYLHYFKEGQPTMDWLDPSFAADRLIAGDVIKTVGVLGAKIIRLDANGFLGIEPVEDSVTAWSEGHPLSVNSTNLVSMLTRKLGGFSFQELNLSFEDIKKFSVNGPDMSYDFITRPAYCHALLTGDASFLRLCLNLMHKYDIDPGALIHSMQVHDELTYELVHFADHGSEMFPFHGKEISGNDLRDFIINQMKEIAAGKNAPYNMLSGNGLCATFASLCTAAFGIKDPYNMTEEETELVKRGHLLLAFYNAMQPGVMSVSGWDLVGALPLPLSSVKELVADEDYRWIIRGAYDLLGENPGADKALSSGLPKAACIYGSLLAQFKDPDSFASRLKDIMQIREKYKINLSEQIAVPEVKNNGVVIMVHRLPDGAGIEMTAINFGRTPAEETVNMKELCNTEITDIINEKAIGEVAGEGSFTFKMEPLSANAYLFTSK
ncbi:MAG: maltose alpha-D-glucosyltransferase [Armatimonadota bacterium]